MSGRLVILPKKSYCPWKPENVQRVLRDEQRHRDEQDQQRRRDAEFASDARLRAMRQAKDRHHDYDNVSRRSSEYCDSEYKIRESDSTRAKVEEHFNLFVAEERMASSAQNCPSRQTNCVEMSRLKDDTEWKQLKEQREARRKAEMDPMKDFDVGDDGFSLAAVFKADAQEARDSNLQQRSINKNVSSKSSCCSENSKEQRRRRKLKRRSKEERFRHRRKRKRES